MGINLVVAVTDDDWFEMLRRKPDLKEVNFWSPSPKNFHALQQGEFFLFKLHAPGAQSSEGESSPVLARISQCAVERRCFSVGANPTRQLSLQPVAVGAVHRGNDMD